MGDGLGELREGRPAHVLYETQFIIEWPEHLGGGSATAHMSGTMVLVPLLEAQ